MEKEKLEMEKVFKQQELDAKLQMEQKEREDRLQREKEIKLKEIEAKVQMEKDKLKNMAHQPPPHN